VRGVVARHIEDEAFELVDEIWKPNATWSRFIAAQLGKLQETS